jgi:hypothetical protein
MLDYARQRAIDILKDPSTAVLVTSGPAGVQASQVACYEDGLDIYLLLPRTSDHLFNLEQNSAILLVAAAWQLKGSARVLKSPPSILNLTRIYTIQGQAEPEWTVMVQVEPIQLQVRHPGGWGNQETLDLNPEG